MLLDKRHENKGIYESFTVNVMDAFASQDPPPSEKPELLGWFGNSKVVVSSGKPLPVFHGSEAEFRKFDYNFIGSGHDMEGPGFYFTNMRDDAEHYSNEQGKIYEVFLKIENPVPMTGEVDRGEVETMILKSLGLKSEEELWALEDSDEYWETRLSDWGEHPVSAFQNMVDGVLKYNTGPHDAFQTVWADAFGFDRSVDYIKGMLELGYDGVIVRKNDGNNHYVVFNPNNIKAVSSEGFSEDEDMYKSEEMMGVEKMAESVHKIENYSKGTPIDPYKCQVCGGKVIGKCRCPSRLHNAESLIEGHGSLCENGHRCGNGLYVNVPMEEVTRRMEPIDLSDMFSDGSR